MLLQYLLPSLLSATAAAAVPVADIMTESEGELVLFKRDDVLESRDLELANLHGVNMTEMYKHAVLKRGDGDHVVIWVARSFDEHQHEHQDEDQQGVTKRQNARPGRESNFRSQSDGVSDYCRSHRRQNHTGPNGPYSGGVQAMYRWARGHRGGSWPVGTGWENLVIAGSNSGANAVYRARRVSGGNLAGSSRIGTMDVRNDADWTQNRAREFSGRGWRASSKGGETCGSNARMNYEIVRTNLRY